MVWRHLAAHSLDLPLQSVRISHLSRHPAPCRVQLHKLLEIVRRKLLRARTHTQDSKENLLALPLRNCREMARQLCRVALKRRLPPANAVHVIRDNALQRSEFGSSMIVEAAGKMLGAWCFESKIREGTYLISDATSGRA